MNAMSGRISRREDCRESMNLEVRLRSSKVAVGSPNKKKAPGVGPGALI